MAPNSTESQAQPTGSSSGAAVVIDHNHPLFMHASDVSGRNKLGMADGSCKKEDFPGLENNWERVNAIVLSWIMNSVSKSLLGGIMYALTASVVWDDLFKRFNKINGSRTFNLHKEIATLSQGLKGILEKTKGSNNSAYNVTGEVDDSVTSSTSTNSNDARDGYMRRWIIDTGATNHVVADLNLLKRHSICKVATPKKELLSGEVKMIGKEDGGLYILSNNIDKEEVVLTVTHTEHKATITEKIDT
ncbi:hypothetical protein KY290_012259 [Solanum tuberosum]|uniref:Retrotransposon Copia-like N-terminal domain-containing protein n=1 Tax=Solanum tuberosum TaxID=4113 RepID=A0ABQ7W345_SOLTU|nr:hypothetical protein KY290_012259 [Solanum tuberosum]